MNDKAATVPQNHILTEAGSAKVRVAARQVTAEAARASGSATNSGLDATLARDRRRQPTAVTALLAAVRGGLSTAQERLWLRLLQASPPSARESQVEQGLRHSTQP